jgi:metal-responsive CopG/Arc/MetJ family transcriptional regulator
MSSVRVNISIPESTYSELKEEVPSRERSKFITSAIKKMIDEMRRDRLAREYREASKEIHRVNKDLEGTLNDGL